ncbi:hypothetical protein WOLCODRAFT_95551 [Wolfiporia cocos MD-104 SS10]|uniref:IRG-type G domain-containing protein n=1 Tax=Wolfiporia cocos (strain MD-104) TaxID=742152 RepID=A0A2H3J5W9_WOLCO|nr:hypothetical protein WOLCODRAFT_95551 [Wolfiporia cocos MD-104 SS10]
MHAQREGPILRQAKEEIERDFREGIRPIIHRSPDEIAATKRRLDYQEGLPHIAVTGVSGAGKSSLINVLRQLLGGGSDLQKARTGVVETTSVTARYKDDEAQVPIVWYDIPGAGTLNKPDWIYFDEHGLYIFDAIIILIDNRFLQSDVAILKNCAAYNIPTFIVRSKSTLHIRNIVSDLRADSEDTDEELEGLDEEREAPLVERARTEYIEQTKGSVQRNLQKAGLQEQMVYLIDRSNLTQIARSNRLRSILNGLQVDDEVELKNKLLIHELELISDLFNAVLQR